MVRDEVFVAGEALIDLVAQPDGHYRAIPGGSPANVAVGLARLGTSTHLLARLGTGAFGVLVRAHLDDNGVHLDHAVAAAEPTTLAVVSLDASGRAGYDFYADGTADWGWTGDELPESLPLTAGALVTGSIAVGREPGASALLALLRREHQRGDITIVLDPNVRPALVGPREAFLPRWDDLLTVADVVKASDEDLEWLAPGVSAADVAADWASRGPALVVVTRGENGAFGRTRAGLTVQVETPPTQVVDTVGAGDAFTSGLVDSLRRSGLLGGESRDELGGLPDAVLRGVLASAALVAAITCNRPGANPPTAAELNTPGYGRSS